MFNPEFFWALIGAAWVIACAVICVVVWHLRGKRKLEKLQIVHQERMKAMEKGVPLPEFPELSDDEVRLDLVPLKCNPRWPLGVGGILVMAGFGHVIGFLLSKDAELQKLWSLGFIGVFLGFGFVLYYFLTRQPEKHD